MYPLTVDEQNIELEIALAESEVNNATIYKPKSFFEQYVWQLYAEHYSTNADAASRNIW